MIDSVEVVDITLTSKTKALGRLDVEFVIRDDSDILKMVSIISSERRSDLADALKKSLREFLEVDK